MHQTLIEKIVQKHAVGLEPGQIVKSGGKELALELEEKGYSWLE